MTKGDIILINFPFTDLSNSKLRPGVVICEHHSDITLCFITSKLSWQEETDLAILPNQINGLKKSSLIRTNKITTLSKSLSRGILGNLNDSEISELNQKLIIALQLT